MAHRERACHTRYLHDKYRQLPHRNFARCLQHHSWLAGKPQAARPIGEGVLALVKDLATGYEVR